MSAEDLVVVDGLPATSVPRTVFCLARDYVDYDHLAGIVRDALGKPEVSASALTQALQPYASRYGKSTGEELFADMTVSSSAARKLNGYFDIVGLP